jgi:hypothetical protein
MVEAASFEIDENWYVSKSKQGTKEIKSWKNILSNWNINEIVQNVCNII